MMQPGRRDLLDITAEFQRGMGTALAVHNPAGAEGIPYALVNAIFERNVDIGLKGFQHPDPHRMMTYFASRNASRRSSVVLILIGRPLASISRWQSS